MTLFNEAIAEIYHLLFYFIVFHVMHPKLASTCSPLFLFSRHCDSTKVYRTTVKVWQLCSDALCEHSFDFLFGNFVYQIQNDETDTEGVCCNLPVFAVENSS